MVVKRFHVILLTGIFMFLVIAVCICSTVLNDSDGITKRQNAVEVVEKQVPPDVDEAKNIENLKTKKISVAIAGGCSSGRLDDMQVIADVLAKHNVHPEVTFIITPGSRNINDAGSRLNTSRNATTMPVAIIQPKSITGRISLTTSEPKACPWCGAAVATKRCEPGIQRGRIRANQRARWERRPIPGSDTD